MITFQQAKKLKEVGFVQGAVNRHGNGTWFDEDGDVTDHETSLENYYNPTLHELIEACIPLRIYPGWITLTQSRAEDGIWIAEESALDPDSQPFVESKGSTPEEAVANLWLALNT